MHVCLEEYGTIDSCECECAAGIRPNAHCRHIRALLYFFFVVVVVVVVLYGLVQLASGNSLYLELTCTDSLQTFHHPKQRHYGSPAKAQALQLDNVK